MDTLQNELDVQYPELDIQLLGVNENGQEQGNSIAVVGRDLPLLQDEDADHNGGSDVWTSWEVEWRDLVVVDAQMERVGVFNLTTYNLANPDNYAAAKEILVGVALGTAFWKNPSNPLDVGGDGQMTPIDDVLRSINELNFPKMIDEAGRLPLPMPQTRPAPYYDVNGDGYLSAAADILPVINYFNRNGGEGEGVPLGEGANDVRPQATTAFPLRIVTPADAESTDSAGAPAASIRSRACGQMASSPSLANKLWSESTDCFGFPLDFARVWQERPDELLDFIDAGPATSIVERLDWLNDLHT